MDKERKKFCNGCTLYERYTSVDNQQCRYLYILKSGEKCPCIDCLVKTTCENACDKFNRYANKSVKEGTIGI